MDRKEFEEDLLSGNVTEKYLGLTKEELKERFGENFMKTVEFGDQNNIHHQYELFEHILRTVDSVDTEAFSKEDAVKLKTAAFFHDIGKPNVAAINEKTGKTQFIGHAKESAIMANEILENMGYSEEEINEIKFLIQCHDEFIPVAKMEDVTPQKISKIFANMNKKLEYYKPTISDMKKLIALCRADSMAQNEVIIRNNEVIDTREDRITRLDAIESVLPEALVLKEEQEIEKLNKQKETVQNGPKPIEKKGKIVNQKQIDIWNSLTDEEKAGKIRELDEQISAIEAEKGRLLETEANKPNFIKAALDNAKRIQMGDKTYLDVMLGQRIEGPTNAGSSYKVESPEELYEKLVNQEWEETTHPDVMPGCRVFKSDLAGLEGILNLKNLPDDVELYAIDPKGTGKVGVGAGKIEKNPVEETYLIIGKENIDGKNEDVVFTFHPGEPVRLSEVETKDIPDGTKISKQEAEKLGFDKVKYLSEEMLEEYRHKAKAQELQAKVDESKELDDEIAKEDKDKVKSK